jgi:ribonuclease HI
MEQRAAIAVLEASPPSSEIRIISRSNYLVEGASNWLAGWQRNGWRTKGGTAVQNRDEWQALAALLRTRAVEFGLDGGDDGAAMALALRLARRRAEESAG